MAPSHGPQFDDFRADSGDPHNGAQHDAFADQRGAEPHGGLTFDQFETRSAHAAHGARWDDFGWQAMPYRHGARFDSGFDEPSMGVAEHGTWHDVFRGGTNVRAVADGRDVEAVILNVHATHAEARTRDGKVVELALAQIREWRPAAVQAAERTDVKTAQGIGNTEGSAAARGSQAQANGGQRSALDALKAHVEDLDVAKTPGSAYGVHQGHGKMKTAVGPFCRSCANTAAGALTGGSVQKHPRAFKGACASCSKPLVNKTSDEDLDVAKVDFGAPYHPVTNQHFGASGSDLRSARPGPLAHPSVHAAYSKVMGTHTTLTAANSAHSARAKAYAKDPSASYKHLAATSDAATRAHQTHQAALTSFHQAVNRHGLDTVHKTVDATETSLHKQDAGETVGHRKGCPRGGDAPCGKATSGKCSACGDPVHDHEALGKTTPGAIADVLKQAGLS